MLLPVLLASCWTSHPGGEADARDVSADESPPDRGDDAGSRDDADGVPESTDDGRDADDDGPDPCACLAAWHADTLTCEQAAAAVDGFRRSCFPLGDPEALERMASECLPFELGVDERNGEMLVAEYFCSDLCPAYGWIPVVYEGVDEWECSEDLGGYPEHDPGWGGYIGCRPGPCEISTWECPDVVPGDDPASVAQVWTFDAADEWTATGSAGLAVGNTAALVGIPVPGTGSTDAPTLLRVATADGTRLDDLPRTLTALAPSQAIAATRVGWDIEIIGASPDTDGVLSLRAQIFDLDGFRTGTWYVPLPPPADPMAGVDTLRAASDGTSRFVVAEGTDATYGLLDALVAAAHDPLGVATAVFPFERWDPREMGFVAAGATGMAWSLVERVVLTDGSLDLLAAGAARTAGPIAAGRDATGEAFLLVTRHDLGSAERLVDILRFQETYLAGTPDVLEVPATGELGYARPVALEPLGDGAVLAWTSTRTSEHPLADCLYLTVLPAAGTRVGTTVRIDRDDASAPRERVEHVRVATRESEAYVLWRRGTSLHLVRADLVP